MLIPYFALYRLSKCLNRSQGYSGHLSKQYLQPLPIRISQFLMKHLMHETDLSASPPRHPGHLFLSLRYAMQRLQFIPQEGLDAVPVERLQMVLEERVDLLFDEILEGGG